MKNFKNSLLKKATALLIVGVMGVMAFNYATVPQEGVQVRGILKDSQESY